MKLQDDDKLRSFFLWINNVLKLKASRLALFLPVSALQHVFEGINSALGLRRIAAVIIITSFIFFTFQVISGSMVWLFYRYNSFGEIMEFRKLHHS